METTVTVEAVGVEMTLPVVAAYQEYLLELLLLIIQIVLAVEPQVKEGLWLSPVAAVAQEQVGAGVFYPLMAVMWEVMVKGNFNWAVGMDERQIRSAVRSARRREDRFRKAVADGTAAFAHGGSFWCIWGFKP